MSCWTGSLRCSLSRVAMTYPSDILYSVHIEAAKDAGESIEAALEAVGETMAVWVDEDTGARVFDDYCEDPEAAEQRMEALRTLIRSWLDAGQCSMAVRPVKKEDWAESWKRHFHVDKVSRRIVVKPSWESYRPRPGECVIELDPGMSFGTGQHPTTRACLELIDEAIAACPGASFLDIGCGSGILAIAAAKLGLKDVLAIDNDPVAVEVCRENAERNGVAGGVECREADLEQFEPGRTYDLVAVNILASVLERNAGKIIRLLAEDDRSRLILSGLMDAQYSGTRRLYEAAGFSEVRAITSGDWTSGCFAWRRG